MTKHHNQDQEDPWAQFLAMLSPEAQEAAIFTKGPHLQTDIQWHLIMVPDTGKPVLSEHHSFEELRKAMREALTHYSTGAILAFCGARVHIARDEGNSQLCYILHPDGAVLPLFDTAPSLQVVADGYLHDEDEGGEETVEVEEEVEEVIEYVEEPAVEQEGGSRPPDPDDEHTGDVEPVEPSDDSDDSDENYP